jgi:hypothetical protein
MSHIKVNWTIPAAYIADEGITFRCISLYAPSRKIFQISLVLQIQSKTALTPARTLAMFPSYDGCP